MKTCRECSHEVSERAKACPQCGAPKPALETFDGWGFEYRSKASIAGIPLLHIAFKYRPNGASVIARGVIAIGQFACGIVTISQFGLGVFSLSQITLSVLAVAQIGFAYSLVAQVGLYLHEGYGQLVWKLADLLQML